MGVDVDVAAFPAREPGMNAVELMTSESQERMLAIVTPDQLDDVLEVARRWEVRATVAGRSPTLVASVCSRHVRRARRARREPRAAAR